MIFVCLGAAVGAFVNGLALFALGFFPSVMTQVEAVGVVVVLSVITGLRGAWKRRGTIRRHLRGLAIFLVPGLVGGLMPIYGAYFLIRRTLPKLDRPMPVIDATVGFLGGAAPTVSVSATRPDWPEPCLRSSPTPPAR